MNSTSTNSEILRRFSPGNSAREIAYRIIRDKIIYFDLKPGEAVSDKLLAEELNMSRTPVREALILLSNYNMVLLKPQAGTFVAPIDEEWLEVEQFSRSAMERDVIKRACIMANKTTAADYKKVMERYNAAEKSDSPDKIRRLLDLDNSFHRVAFVACGRVNNFYHMTNYMQHIERLRVLSSLMKNEEFITNDHECIANAVLEGDTIAAQYWLDQHLRRYTERLRLAKSSHPEYFELG